MFIKSKVKSGAWRHDEISSVTVNRSDPYTWNVYITLSKVSGCHLYDSHKTKESALASRDELIKQLELLETGNWAKFAQAKKAEQRAGKD